MKTLIILMIILVVGSTAVEAQIYMVNGRQISGTDSIAIGNPKIGGISLGLRDNIYGKGLLKGNQFLFLLNGRQELGTSQNWNQTTIPDSWNQSFTSFMHLRTIDAGYGRQLFSTDNLSLYIGVHFSKIFGIGLSV